MEWYYMYFTFILYISLTNCFEQFRSLNVNSYGGYEQILVAIDPKVPYESSILENIEEYLAQTSDQLFDATLFDSIPPRFFSDITIIIPQTWPKVDICRPITSQNAANANFLIAQETEQWGSAPHTIRKDNRCGSTEGVTIIPLTFLQSQTEAKKYGKHIGKTLLHEWAHQRYGVFDEDNGDTCLAFEGGYTFPRRCSSNIQGNIKMSADGKKCSFQPNKEQSVEASSSVMFRSGLEHARGFCNRNTAANIRHNENITNEQNDRCDGKSVLEVLKSHPDFESNLVTSFPSSATRVPKFKCVQEDVITKMVLALDVSRSMRSQGRLDQMKSDVQRFLQTTPCSNTAVGMVEFSDYSSERTIHEMVPLNSIENVQSLISALPESAIDKTCIACGIRQSIRTLRLGGFNTEGAIIAIFTDGVENEEELTLADVREEILESGVNLFASVLHNLDADSALLQLVHTTGGRYCRLYDDQTATYYDCLEHMLTHKSPLHKKSSVLISSDGMKIESGEEYIASFPFDIDGSLIFHLEWNKYSYTACKNVVLTLTKPDGTLLRKHVDEAWTTAVTVRSADNNMGRWEYSVANEGNFDCNARLQIEGKLRKQNCEHLSKSDDMVVLTPSIQYSKDPHGSESTIRLYTRVSIGSTPVIRAHVTAHVSRQDGTVIHMELWDNGAGADIQRDDGIYSRYFVEDDNLENKESREYMYNVKFDAIWTSSTRTQYSSSSYAMGAKPLAEIEGLPTHDLRQIGEFRRSSTGHLFSLSEHEHMTNTPAKITDLSIQQILSETKELLFSWTAMGSTLDHGTASFCILQVSDDVRNLRDSKKDNIKASFQFKTLAEAGSKELFQVSLEDYSDILPGRVYYATVSTYTQYDHSSPSNAVMFVFANKQPYLTQKQKDNALHTWIIGLILAIISILIISFVLVFFLCYRKNKQRIPDNDSEKELNITDVLSVPSDCDTSVNTSSQNSAIPNATTKTSQDEDLVTQISLIKSRMRHIQTPENSDSSSDTSSEKTMCSRKPVVQNSEGKNLKKPYGRVVIHPSNYNVTGQIQRNRPNTAEQKNSEMKSIATDVWSNRDEPLQNHSYSNPLFREAPLIPEVELKNSAVHM